MPSPAGCLNVTVIHSMSSTQIVAFDSVSSPVVTHHCYPQHASLCRQPAVAPKLTVMHSSPERHCRPQHRDFWPSSDFAIAATFFAALSVGIWSSFTPRCALPVGFKIRHDMTNRAISCCALTLSLYAFTWLYTVNVLLHCLTLWRRQLRMDTLI